MDTQLEVRAMIAGQAEDQTPRVVEIVGPAGAGKSTLRQALTKASARIQSTTFPDVRNLRAAPFFVWHGLRRSRNLLPSRGSRRITAREFAWLCILDGWAGLLQRGWQSSKRMQLLDQGPVYLFSELSESGPQHLKMQLSNATLGVFYEKWAAVLDAIVWLDAPNEVLVQRIRSREKGHIVKGERDEAVVQFIARFRGAYERSIHMLSARNASLRVLRFDTNMFTADEIACELTMTFRL